MSKKETTCAVLILLTFPLLAPDWYSDTPLSQAGSGRAGEQERKRRTEWRGPSPGLHHTHPHVQHPVVVLRAELTQDSWSGHPASTETQHASLERAGIWSLAWVCTQALTSCAPLAKSLNHPRTRLSYQCNGVCVGGLGDGVLGGLGLSHGIWDFMVLAE